jgi:hypothetical protein
MCDDGDFCNCCIGEFEIKMNELVRNEVNERIGQAAIDLENYIADNKKLRAANTELLLNLRQIERDNKAALTKALREKEIDVKRDIFGGFTIGDTCFFAKSDLLRHPCEKCEGKGKVSVQIAGEEKSVRCPYCNGDKSTHTCHYSPKKARIVDMRVEFRGGNCSAKWQHFSLDCNETGDYAPDDLFKTIEECQAVCDMENAPKVAEPTP